MAVNNISMVSLVSVFIAISILLFDERSTVSVWGISLNDAGAIEEACWHATYRDLCVSSLKSDRRSYEANYHGLARIAIELALKNGTDTRAYIEQLESQASDPVVKDSLKNCADDYMAGMVLDIPEALKEFDSQSYKSAADTLSFCEVCADDCEREFTEGSPKLIRPSPLTHRNQVMHQLCSIAADLTMMISKQY